jgi:hypothetical protein
MGFFFVFAHGSSLGTYHQAMEFTSVFGTLLRDK